METKILDLLAEICDDDIVKENEDIDLFETGLVDSLTFTEILVAIEDNFGVIIAPSEVDRAELGTPRKIIESVRSRLNK